jgi:hypothetical protein
MARIRTIKPEFFTSEDIVALPPLTRLLYIAIWCEADKEGRLPWKPMTFKLRYFPADNCDIKAMCAELVEAGLVVLYSEGLAYIPSFGKHQHINPRESQSTLPSPHACPTRHDASARVSDGESTVTDAQGGREGKGTLDTRDASREVEPAGFADFWAAWPTSDRKQAKGKCLAAWKKAHAERVAADVLAHVKRMKASEAWTKQGGQFIPAPLVYLNDRRWEGAEAGQGSLVNESSPHGVLV